MSADAAVQRFLEAMHTAGDPGAEKFPLARRKAFRRAGTVRGWVPRPVDREDFEKPRRYVPGLLLDVDGAFHVLDSELRGWGQREFPYYHHTVQPEPAEVTVDERLAGELDALLREHAAAG